MTPQLYFILVVVGLPLLMLLIAAVGGYSYREGYQRLLDWIPARLGREVTLHSSETEQLLEAINRHRRARGEPERTLDDIGPSA